MIQKQFYTLFLLLFGLNLLAGPDNIAPKAKITASTSLNPKFRSKKYY